MLTGNMERSPKFFSEARPWLDMVKLFGNAFSLVYLKKTGYHIQKALRSCLSRHVSFFFVIHAAY